MLCWRIPTYPKNTADPRYFYFFKARNLINDKNLLKTKKEIIRKHAIFVAGRRGGNEKKSLPTCTYPIFGDPLHQHNMYFFMPYCTTFD